MSDARSNYLRASAAFAGHHGLMPRADERVTQFVELANGCIAVTYQGREKARALLVGPKAGGFAVLNSVTVNLAGKPKANLELGIPATPQFHLKETHTARVPLTHRQKALRHYNLLGW